MSFGAIGGAAASALPGILGSVGASAGAGLLGSLFGGGQAGESGFNVTTIPLTADQQVGSSFLANQLQSLQQPGGALGPSFFQESIPLLRRNLASGLSRDFFGLPGQRNEGTFAKSVNLGALTGLGPRASVAQGNKQLQNFQQQSQSIDEFIAKTGIDISRETALNAPRSLAALTPQSFATPFSVAGSSGVDFGTDDFLGAASSGLSDIFSSIPNIFNSGGGGGGGGTNLSQQVSAFGGGVNQFSPPTQSQISQFRVA
jgi:hypothetical protein